MQAEFYHYVTYSKRVKRMGSHAVMLLTTVCVRLASDISSFLQVQTRLTSFKNCLAGITDRVEGEPVPRYDANLADHCMSSLLLFLSGQPANSPTQLR